MPFLLNQDFIDFAVGRPVEKLTREELLKQIDLFEINGDCTVLLNPNGQKAGYESEVLETLWNGVEFKEDGKAYYRGKELTGHFKALPEKMKALYDNVNDLYEVRLAYGRKKGYKMFLSMRMNDIHWICDFDNVLVSDFWREHQDCLITDFNPEAAWWFGCFDYAKKEVYDHHLALVKEYLTKFDPDGLELDWMRSPYYFKPGWEEQNMEILTQFMRETKKLAEECAARNGHPIELIVRLPSCPDAALRMGFDFHTWAEEKLIDRIVATSYWGVTDFDIPLEIWRMAVGGKVKITAGLELYSRCSPFQKLDYRNDAATVFGFASSFYYRGSDDIYLFNYMDDTGMATGMTNLEELRLVLANIGNRENVERQARRHLVTYTDLKARAIGCATPGILPLELNEGYKFIRLNLGGKVKNRNARLVIACDNGLPAEVYCGGVLCEKTEESFTKQMSSSIKDPVVYRIPDEGLKDGDNILCFRGTGEKNNLYWCEIDLDEA